MGIISKIFCLHKQKQHDEKSIQPKETYILKNGKLVLADERRKAYLYGNLESMLVQVYKEGDPVDTHFLYLSIVQITYKQRKDKKMREIFKKIASEHVSKFDTLVTPLRNSDVTMKGKLPGVPTFQYIATVYTEDEEYEKAIKVCEKAIKFGIEDGTKTGFQGRIERIRKKSQIRSSL